ncbi:MAG: TolB family protein, partial [Bacteroidia bacterium]
MILLRSSFWLILFLALPFFLEAQKAERLSSAINSQFEEREPMPTHDGQYLYIWRRQHPRNTGGNNDQGDIWVAKLGPNGKFLPAERLRSPLNSYGTDFVWQTSPNHDTLFVSQIVQAGQKGFYYSVRLPNGRWSNQRSWTIEDHTPLGEYKDYAITSTGHLLLPNKGVDTEGGPDIYVAFKKGPGVWGKPMNLGPDVNSRFNEDAPHLMPDGETLYFNSGIGRGGPHDVYVTKRLDNTWKRWSAPQNVGPPINTKIGYEADFMISPDGKWAYWIADPKREGNVDIFRMPLNRCEVDAYIDGDTRMCDGDSLEIEAGFNTLGNVRYQWYLDGRKIAGATNKKHMATAPGSYQVERQSPGCLVKSSPLAINSKPSPKANLGTDDLFLCDKKSQVLNANASGNTNRWQWMRNGLKIPGANGPSLLVDRPGTYSVTVGNGECSSNSNSVRVGKMVTPYIFPRNMADKRSRPVPYEWRWTAGLGKSKSYILQDMASDPLGQSAVLALVKNGKYYEEVLMSFGREGEAQIQKNFGTADPRAKRFVATDYEGNVILANREKFLRKYDSNGSLQWQVEQRVEDVSGLAVDPLGHVYVYGRFKKSVRIG